MSAQPFFSRTSAESAYLTEASYVVSWEPALADTSTSPRRNGVELN